MIRACGFSGSLAAVLLLAGCGGDKAVRAPAAADRPTIVSLNPCTDAILAEIAPPGQLLALSHYSRDPRASSMDIGEARRYGTTGGTVEEVLALDPDVVVASVFMAPSTRSALSDLGIAVQTVGIASDVEASIAQIRGLSAAVGRDAEGEALVARIESAMRSHAVVPETPARSAVLWQPGGIVPGKGALASQLMAHVGLASHSAARGLQQADYLSLERLLTDPPEVLLVAGNERGQSHPAMEQLSALRVEPFDAALLYCGGPTIIRALDRLAEVRGPT